ncbi:MAG TPA: cation transporter, partial [Acidimicrobiia bacterium]|nr:cation transporter [Acidimicrobiia bacterium]
MEFAVRGMACGACAARIEKALRAGEGVVDAGVNFATARARVAYDPGRTGTGGLSVLFDSLGYEAAVVERDRTAVLDDARDVQPWRDWFVRAAVAWPLALALLVAPALRPGRGSGAAAALVVAAIVLFGCGRPFLRGAVIAARHRTATMDTLIATAVLAAYAASVWHFLVGGAGGAHHGAASASGGHGHQNGVAVVVATLLVGRGL